MKQRKRTVDGLPRAVEEPERVDRARQRERVGDHHPLGRPRRPGRVHDRLEPVRLDAGARGGAASGEQAGQWDGGLAQAAGERVPDRPDHNRAERLRLQPVEPIQQPLLDDEQRAVGALQDVQQHVAAQLGVDGYHHGPDPGQGEGRQNNVGTVVEHHRHVVADAHAVGIEAAG